MTEDRDPFLQTIFAENQQQLDDEEFVHSVVQRTTLLKRNLLLTFASSILLLLLLSWIFSWPLLGLAMVFTSTLSTELFALGNGAIAWMLTPVNNLATVFLIIWRLFRFGWNRATNLSYVN